MGYDKDKIYEQAISDIKEHNLFFISDIVAYSSCSTSTFYEFFPADSEQSETLKELLDQNKVAMKVKLRVKLANGEKAAEILALYKLIATDTERRALSMQHIDHTTKGDKVNVISLGTGSNPDETTT
tara:strand:+ start:124 stop:504 length:381 start_codon:yes stop_codon:yes gene_type:complete